MYDYIKGKKVKAGNGVIVLENAGIGYFFNVSDECIKRLDGLENICLYAYLSV